MSWSELNDLVAAGKLKREFPTQAEFDGLMQSGEALLADAKNPYLLPEIRFDLICDAAHALAFAALRWHGFCPESGTAVFQTLPHTLGLSPKVWRVLAKGRKLRDLREYGGRPQIDDRLVGDLSRAAAALRAAVVTLSLARTPGSRCG